MQGLAYNVVTFVITCSVCTIPCTKSSRSNFSRMVMMTPIQHHVNVLKYFDAILKLCFMLTCQFIRPHNVMVNICQNLHNDVTVHMI